MQNRTFKLRLNIPAARTLSQGNYTSIKSALTNKYPILNGVGVGGFNVADVIAVLGGQYEASLNDAGIKNATVPQEIATRFGYESSLVLMDVDALYKKAHPTFEIRSVKPRFKVKSVMQPTQG